VVKSIIYIYIEKKRIQNEIFLLFFNIMHFILFSISIKDFKYLLIIFKIFYTKLRLNGKSLSLVFIKLKLYS